MSKKRIVSVLLALALLLAMPFAASAATFSDIQGHWAQNTIEMWLKEGWTSGYADGTFKPDNPINRAELFTLVNKVSDFTETADINYRDVKPTDWFYKEFQKAQKAGYSKGYPDNTARPLNNVTREELAALVHQLKKLEDNPAAADAYKDANQMTWSKAAIGACLATGAMSGYPDMTFKPKKDVTRAEAMFALCRALGIELAAPNVTADDEKDLIRGITQIMEYSIDGGGWVTYNPARVPDLSGDHTVLVRYAATATQDASPETKLIFTLAVEEEEEEDVIPPAVIGGGPSATVANYKLTLRITDNINMVEAVSQKQVVAGTSSFYAEAVDLLNANRDALKVFADPEARNIMDDGIAARAGGTLDTFLNTKIAPTLTAEAKATILNPNVKMSELQGTNVLTYKTPVGGKNYIVTIKVER